ncbi:MAG: cadmium-translocating P-type ATPase [Lachnospiraceae bacterium]|nr:cadmium-translocating P-type ATPase [Lachnospiraceae bacterium]
MSKKQKKRLYRILIAAAIFVVGFFLEHIGWVPDWVRLIVFLVCYAVIGWDVVWKAVRNITHGQVFDENFLMSLATVGAFFIGDYAEAVAVMLFYQVGELFQSYAVDKSRKSIADLMDIRPDYANLLRDGVTEEVDPEEVAIGDWIIVKPGERVPLDGVILEGKTTFDTSALTGESMPRDAAAGDAIISGCINLTGTITVQVTKEFGESTVAKILDLVENASSRKANAENFITKFARYYTPAVVIVAVLIAIVPPLVIPGQIFSDWLYRALSFLVVSCPCALVISIPLGFFGGIGGASKCGILVKGSNYLEALAAAEMIVFDKTGTLTKGNFAVTKIEPAEGMEEAELLRIAAYAESDSSHPISVSIRKAYGQEIPEGVAKVVEEIAGHGVKAVIEGRTIYAGNARLMARQGIAIPENSEIGTIVYLASESEYLGSILIADEVKPDAADAVLWLKLEGIRRVVMLTGDQTEVGERIARELGIEERYCELLPGDKVDKVEELLKQTSPKGKLIYVGDGINDAPVLARADIGIAMGGLGSDAAIEAADIVIMTDEPSKIVKAFRISEKTMEIVKQNIIFALAVKGIVLLLTAFGLSNMWEAVFADVGVAVIAILNSMRAMKVPKKRWEQEID